jgi:multidrug resistance efflux pump
LQSEAQLAVVQANQGRTQQAITQEDLDNATQNNLASKAQVQAARAAVETARAQIQGANATVQAARASVETAQLGVGFTRLTSLVDGILESPSNRWARLSARAVERLLRYRQSIQ